MMNLEKINKELDCNLIDQLIFMEMLISAEMEVPETLQLDLVKKSHRAIEYIIEAGIKPSQTVTNAHYLKWEL